MAEFTRRVRATAERRMNREPLSAACFRHAKDAKQEPMKQRRLFAARFSALFRSAQEIGASLCHLAIWLGAGEFCPASLFNQLVAFPRLGFLESFQIGARIRGALKSIDANWR